MPELKKRIVIASVLKPVSDTRMTEKIAATLARDPDLDVHVIGYPANYFPNEKITLHSFAPFARISFARIATPLKVLKIVLTLRPSVLIVTTHELLGCALLVRWLTKAKIVYDVQENYYLNILHTNAFNSFLKFPIAWYVRLKEKLSRNWVDRFFLAEEIYAVQLPFTKGRSIILANKVNEFPSRNVITENSISLIFSGTLSRSTGVFDAIRLAQHLHQADPKITLTIIGFASLPGELDDIVREISNTTFIRLIGGHSVVNHEEIVQAISQSAAGIISYQPSPATAGRIPTKLYEYIAAGISIIFTRPSPEWNALADEAGSKNVVLDPANPDILAFMNLMNKPFTRGTNPAFVYWKSEEIKLKTAISTL